MNIDELPNWLHTEILTQAPVGSRNNHAMKLAPSLLRAGMTPEEALNALRALYPAARPGELEALMQRAELYAQTDRAIEGEWAEKKARREKIRVAAAAELPQMLREYQFADFESKTLDLSLDEQRRHFIKAMFCVDDVLWIGDKFSSGPRFAHCFRPQRAWLAAPKIEGEFASFSTFKPFSTHRNGESIAETRYTVVESDSLRPHELASVAECLRMRHGLTLRAVVTTGGARFAPDVSCHYWYDFVGTEHLEDWAAVLSGYDCDPATLRGPQPVRLPGCIRKDTGLPQELLFLS